MIQRRDALKSKDEPARPVGTIARNRAVWKQRLVSVSTRMFAGRGFEAVSLREITREAGLSLPVVYWFFADKRSLYEACCLHALKASLQRIAVSAANQGDAREVLLAMTTTLCELHLSGGGTRLLHRLLLDNDSGILAKMVPVLKRSKAFEALRRAVQALSPSAQSELETFALLALVAGFVEHLRLVRLAKIGTAELATPRSIAMFILSMLFRSEDWTETGRGRAG